MQFIDLKAQYEFLQERIDKRIKGVLEHGKFIMGPEVAELEEKLSSYVGVKHTISCANGTDALTLALMALGVGSGDVVFCPTFTFFATAEAISFQGAEPVFVDSDEATFNMSPAHLEQQILATLKNGTGEPKAIIAVDLFGLPADYEAIRSIADKYDLKLIEDAAQGFGGSINGRKAGTFGDIATTSFFPAKPLGCYGDGGALFTDNEEYAELLRSFRMHGKGLDRYDNVRVGMNSRLDTIQAAILIEKLAAFPRELEMRNKAAKEYSEKFASKFEAPVVPDGYYSSWAQYTVKSDDRDKYIEHYRTQGIPTMVYYRTCMHQQTAFKHLGLNDEMFPVASKLADRCFSLPMHGYLPSDWIEIF